MKLNKKEVWSGSYKGINFEINHWHNFKENWTFYLYLVIEAIPEAAKPKSYLLRKKHYPVGDKKRFFYDYYKHPVIGSIDFHGGITWYSKEDENKAIRVGCDYSHYWDEGNFYNVDILTADAKIAIDSFREMVTGYKYRCSTVGGYWSLDEGLVYKTDKGEEIFISNKGVAWRKEQGWDEFPSGKIIK